MVLGYMHMCIPTHDSLDMDTTRERNTNIDRNSEIDVHVGTEYSALSVWGDSYTLVMLHYILSIEGGVGSTHWEGWVDRRACQLNRNNM